MSKRYEYYLGSMSIKDNETNKVYDYVEDLLNEQDQKIKDLEHRLSNCIELPVKIGNEVYKICPKCNDNHNGSCKNCAWGGCCCDVVEFLDQLEEVSNARTNK